MKPKILKLYTIVLFLLFIGTSCQKDELEYSDESIEISTIPSICIYKTNGDYTDYLPVGLDSSGNVTFTKVFGNDPLIVTKKSNGSYVLNSRYFLKNGYILEDVNLDYAFTDITVTEMVEKYLEIGSSYWSNDEYESRIIDKSPFSEFYRYDGRYKPEILYSLGEINEMIENGTLEEQFDKLK